LPPGQRKNSTYPQVFSVDLPDGGSEAREGPIHGREGKRRREGGIYRAAEQA
jgi:hypothetical protein